MLKDLEKYPRAAAYMQTFGPNAISYDYELGFKITAWDGNSIITWSTQHVIDIEWLLAHNIKPKSNQQYKRYVEIKND